MRPSASPADLFPASFFKENFPSVGPLVLAIINSSIATSEVPDVFKHAVVKPLIKKTGLDPSVCANFRPISKRPFISKILEKIAFIQLSTFLNGNEIFEKFQSRFKHLHSTETALVCVYNNVLLGKNTGPGTSGPDCSCWYC